MEQGITFKQESFSQFSVFLQREVKFDVYIPQGNYTRQTLLLLNDGQDLAQLNYGQLLQQYLSQPQASGLWTVAIHAQERIHEYGTARFMDVHGRGSRADLYTRFIVKELLPFLQQFYHQKWDEKAFAGFSLGGLSALDIVWNNPQIFSKAGVFSGSLWWRSMENGDDCRIMHKQITRDARREQLQFFFECGDQEETADRNTNGIIDAVEDTQDLVNVLRKKGYDNAQALHFEVVKNGKHDYATWASVMPGFLGWLTK
ncbi:enterochelin esterase-like enzyme [Chitinophaga skermanii]|uniref:Enterochelin esterase-like enzyme n=1 Tax=Chitinophaga skermanii TaxID=331697 RepID=A0A327QLW7_9BACT|nr:alpha/beta hydrolase-fold protein [Chitinophaga skermanii]RAJ05251.1 enterochelin esterase-like enzyme [Chitinophaga skermanii]